jgi:hypothetical protein
VWGLFASLVLDPEVIADRDQFGIALPPLPENPLRGEIREIGSQTLISMEPLNLSRL